MNKNKNLFHWFENPDECLILLESKVARELSTKIKGKYGYNKNIIKIFGDCKFIYQLRKNKPIRIKTLKKILDLLDLDYSRFNKYVKAVGGGKSVFVINFPININIRESAVLIGAFMSDGGNQLQHPFYCNVGFLGNKILRSIQTFLPNIPWETRNGNLRFHSILSRLLLKLEVPVGNKTLLNPRIPLLIYKKRRYKKEYLTQIFDDEGHAPTKISRKIVLGRSIAIKKLPKKFVPKLIYNEKIYFNKLPENIKEIINKQPPNLLSGEYDLLKEFGITSSIRCRGITKYLDSISADWVIEIAGKENIRNFNKRVGFSSPEKIKQTNYYLGR